MGLVTRTVGKSPNQLLIDDVPVSELVQAYGTPTYVYSKTVIEDNYRHFESAFSVFDESAIFFAIKACPNPHIAKLLTSLGSGIDAASPHEIQLALDLGLTPSQIMYTGNSLSDSDIEFGIRKGVHFNVDDHSILPRIFRLGTPRSLCFRINIGSEDEGGLLNFSGEQSKFGILPQYLDDALRMVRNHGITNVSLHMMPGSCKLDEKYFVENARTLAQIATTHMRALSMDLNFLDLGGGIGIPYNDQEKPVNIENVFRSIKEVIAPIFATTGLRMPKIVMEPARYFVGDAGYLLGRVHSIKSAAETIIGTDLSMNTMVRTILYKTRHRILVNGKMHHAQESAGMCGQVCENTDYYIRNHDFPSTIAVDDVLVMRDVGAYGYCMAYDYNGRGLPAEVLVSGDQHRLIRRRKSYDDLLALVEGDDWRVSGPTRPKRRGANSR